MKLTFESFKDEDRFIVTDFCCEPSRELLGKEGLYKILWNRKGKMDLKVDNYKVDLGENEVIFCTPQNIMQITSNQESLIAFVFNKQFFCIQTHDDQVSCNGLLFYGSSQNPKIKLCEKEVRQFKNIEKQFQEDFDVKDHLQGEMLRSLLKRLLIISTRMVKQDLPDPNISLAQINIVRQFNILVEKHFREFHQVKDYANLLFKSPKTLANLFPKYSEKTPLMLINDRILLEAKRLLLYSDKSSAEISVELGYRNAGHFAKFFKKHEQLSPNVFRKSKRSQKVD